MLITLRERESRLFLFLKEFRLEYHFSRFDLAGVNSQADILEDVSTFDIRASLHFEVLDGDDRVTGFEGIAMGVRGDDWSGSRSCGIEGV